MKRRYFILFAFTFILFQVKGQTVKTDVLVVGNGSNALSAGIQAAVSGVQATILTREAEFEIADSKGSINCGIQAEYIRRIGMKAESQNAAVKSWTDSIANLKVITGALWSKIKRTGSGWTVELSDGRKIKALVLVNADRSGSVNNALLLPSSPLVLRAFNYGDNSYRTSIGSGISINNSNATYLTLEAILSPDQENLIMLDANHESLIVGQAAGATAAYAAFFKKKTSETNLKEVQGELIKYKLALVPFSDISEQDTNWRAIQFLGLSGILKGQIKDGILYFNPDEVVHTADVREPIKEYYYKAQIWFDDYRGDLMTLGSTLQLICYVKGKSLEATTAEVKKKWTASYGFKDEFNTDKAITRREFSVLSGDYLQPFNVTIDRTGRVTR